MKTKRIISAAVVIVSLFMLRSCSSPNCENSKSEYQDGYLMGKKVRSMGESYSCHAFVKVYNEQASRDAFKTTGCFCEGYKDGLHGQSIKYQKTNHKEPI